MRLYWVYTHLIKNEVHGLYRGRYRITGRKMELLTPRTRFPIGSAPVNYLCQFMINLNLLFISRPIHVNSKHLIFRAEFCCQFQRPYVLFILLSPVDDNIFEPVVVATKYCVCSCFSLQ